MVDSVRRKCLAAAETGEGFPMIEMGLGDSCHSIVNRDHNVIKIKPPLVLGAVGAYR